MLHRCFFHRKKGPEEGHVRWTSGLHVHMHVCAPPPHKHACRKIYYTSVNQVKLRKVKILQMNGQNPAEVVSWDLRGSSSLYHSDTLGKGKVPIEELHVVGFSKVSLKLLLSVLQSLADLPWR